MNDDWLDDALDRLPPEAVPEGFADRVMARLARELPPPRAARPLLRGPWSRWATRSAAALLLLAVGFWFGQGAPIPRPEVRSSDDAVTASGELLEMYRNQELLDSWDLVTDGELELGLRDATLGTWDLDPDPEGAQEGAER